MTVLVFLHGTAIMHHSGAGVSREERVRQVVAHERSVHEYGTYVPVGDAVGKLSGWAGQGAGIAYLSSHRAAEWVHMDRSVLSRYGFPDGEIHLRLAGEAYADVIGRVLPDVLVEDDCESIGGRPQMAYPSLTSELRARVGSVVVREFEGIGHLPADLGRLAALAGIPLAE